ncbi:MAG: efflux RND transporter permease subunit, partial [Pseudomonadota bacterium]
SPDGFVTRLSDVATVAKGERLPRTSIAEVDGRPAILIAARMENDRQVDQWMARVRTEIDNAKSTLPGGLVLTTVFDQSTYTADRLAEVGGNMGLGVALVIGVLLLTLGFRPAISVALVLPIVTLASLATLNILGVTIHQMSVTGLIVALGLLVDAAIVMTDEIRKRLEARMAGVDAVREAVRRLAAPLFASTVTTALAFMPMALLPGPAGDFVGSIAISVIVMLIWSFVIAMTITPALSGWLLASRRPGRRRGLGGGISGGAMARLFERSIQLALARPRLAVLYAIVLPICGFLAFPTLTAQFFPGVDRDQFYIDIEMPPGTSIDETARAANAAYGLLEGRADIRSVSWVVGESAPSFYYNMLNDRDGSPDYAKMLVTTTSAEATAALVPELQVTLNDGLPQARVIVRDLVQGPPVSAPVELRFVGDNVAALRRVGEAARQIVAEIPEVTIVRTSLGDSPPKLEFTLDEDAAQLTGLDLVAIARQLDGTLEGATGGSLVEGTEELPVRVRVADVARGDLDFIGSLDAIGVGGLPSADAGSETYRGVPLSALGSVTLVPSDAAILRRNGERTNTVQAFVQYGVLPEAVLQKAVAAIEEAGLEMPAGTRIELGGDADARAETLSNLLGPIGLIVTLTIATIVMTFNSVRLSLVAFAVMVLSAGLSILALAVFDFPFGIQAVIGVIGSIGVSINAAIIIMTALQADEGAVAGDRDAATAVVMGASRHIISTTVTTFGGFLPLILAGGGFWPPFAVAVAGGVLLSTVVSFYFTPPMFMLLGTRRKKRFAEGVSRSDTPAEPRPEPEPQPVRPAQTIPTAAPAPAAEPVAVTAVPAEVATPARTVPDVPAFLRWPRPRNA